MESSQWTSIGGMFVCLLQQTIRPRFLAHCFLSSDVQKKSSLHLCRYQFFSSNYYYNHILSFSFLIQLSFFITVPAPSLDMIVVCFL